jgi:hypothetical protein
VTPLPRPTRRQHLVSVTLVLGGARRSGPRQLRGARLRPPRAVVTRPRRRRRPVELTPTAHGVAAPDDVDGPGRGHLELYANDLTVRTNHVDDHHALLIPAATFPYVEGGEDRPHEVHLPAPDRRAGLVAAPRATPDTYVAERPRPPRRQRVRGRRPPPRGLRGRRGPPHASCGPATAAGTRTSTASPRAEPRSPRRPSSCSAASSPSSATRLLCVGWDEGGGGLEHRDGAVLQMPVRTFQDPDQYRPVPVARRARVPAPVERQAPRPADLVRPDYERPTHSESLWVAEGWTAYYDELLPLRAGVWTLKRTSTSSATPGSTVLDTPGARCSRCGRRAPTRRGPSTTSATRTPPTPTDYYGHGALVAWELDLVIRRAGRTGTGSTPPPTLLWERFGRTGTGYTEDDVTSEG